MGLIPPPRLSTIDSAGRRYKRDRLESKMKMIKMNIRVLNPIFIFSSLASFFSILVLGDSAITYLNLGAFTLNASLFWFWKRLYKNFKPEYAKELLKIKFRVK